MRFKQLLLISLLIPVFASAQIIEGTGEKIDLLKVKAWLPRMNQEYQSVYHFGNSEWESEFILIIINNSWFAQIRAGKWETIDGKDNWLWNYENLENVRIEGNNFYSDKTDGEFVICDNKPGLIIYNPWRSVAKPGEYEIGYAICPVEQQFPGKYTFASYRLLSKDELLKMSKSELQIMRNEIFARYGYIFNSGSEMDSYFKKQKWYGGQHPDVSIFLNGLEKENIELIQLVEKSKNK